MPTTNRLPVHPESVQAHVKSTLSEQPRRDPSNPRPAAKRTILALLATIIPNAPGGNHWALHGTAINPDSGAIAEYRELSKYSDGHHWQTSNEEEVGRMFQSLGPASDMPTGTNTLFFINRDQVPKHKRATYIRVVCADRPKKSNT
jgi:hypothetical protein